MTIARPDPLCYSLGLAINRWHFSPILMKFLLAQILHLVKERPNRINLIALGRFLLTLAVLVTVYSVIFHYIMEYEGRSQSWVTGFYWTLTVMSTLGFGDITFNSDLGRIFSIIVLLSGIVFLLILLPFTFIEFFYAPWMKAQQAARAPTRLPEKTRDHVILTHFDSVTRSLIEKLNQYQYSYVLLVADLNEALNLHDMGYRVMLGELDSPQTYRLARVDQALMVATTGTDQMNANVAATVREVSETVPILATANFRASVDILELAGCNHVLQLGEMMGQAVARRVSGDERQAYPIGHFDELMIVETMVRDTSLVGQTLAETQLRQRVGINVLGTWQPRSNRSTCITICSMRRSRSMPRSSSSGPGAWDGRLRVRWPPAASIIASWRKRRNASATRKNTCWAMRLNWKCWKRLASARRPSPSSPPTMTI